MNTEDIAYFMNKTYGYGIVKSFCVMKKSESAVPPVPKVPKVPSATSAPKAAKPPSNPTLPKLEHQEPSRHHEFQYFNPPEHDEQDNPAHLKNDSELQSIIQTHTPATESLVANNDPRAAYYQNALDSAINVLNWRKENGVSVNMGKVTGPVWYQKYYHSPGAKENAESNYEFGLKQEGRTGLLRQPGGSI